MNLEKLGAVIHNKREEVGVPLAKAAQKAGIGRSTLWILEHGKNPKTGKPSRPSKDILERLAEVLRMNQDELAEALTLADYHVTRQSSQASNHISAATKTDITQHSSSPAPTIIEINGIVYYAHDGYLEAFDARTGQRFWSSPSDVPPLEPAHDFVSGRVEQVRISPLPLTVDLDTKPQKIFSRKPQKATKANIRELAELGFPGTRVGDLQASKGAIDKVGRFVEAICKYLVSGELERGGRLPALSKLEKEFEIPQNRLNKELQELEAVGWNLSHGPNGYFVMSRVRIPGLLKNPSDYTKELGVEPIEEDIEEVKIIPPPIEIAEAMKLDSDGLVVRRFRKFGIPNDIFRTIETYFPKKLVSDEMVKRMDDPHYDALEDIKKASGEYIKHVHETLLARLPTQDEQDLLKIGRTNPVFDIKRSNYSQDKKTVVMFNHMVLNANHFLLSYDYSVKFWD